MYQRIMAILAPLCAASLWHTRDCERARQTVPAVIDEIDGGSEEAWLPPPTGNADALAPRCARRGDQGSVNFGVRLAHGIAFGIASFELDRKIGERSVP